MASKVNIGDLIEIRTSKGLAYALYTHSVPQWGSLIAVFRGVHENRPTDLQSVISNETQFKTFFPLKYALKQNIFEVVGNFKVPSDLKEFPLFKVRGTIDRDGRVLDWGLWDGNKEWNIPALDEKQKYYPNLEVCNDTAIIERIEDGWTPDMVKV